MADLHLVNPVVRGATVGAVAATMQSGNQVNVTFSGGQAEGNESIGLLAG